MDLASNINVDVKILKEPRGFIRVLQFVLAIFAFATLCTSTEMSIKVTCPGNHSSTAIQTFKYSYPFNIEGEVEVPSSFCSQGAVQQKGVLVGNFSASAQFFCFVGVMSFLFCIFLVVAYVVFSPLFIKASRAANVDFIGSCVWTAMWFIASCAWADNLSKMGSYMDPANVINELRRNTPAPCQEATCSPNENPDHSALIVSVLFGFLNFLLWGASLWFLFKETQWHREPVDDQQGFDQPHQSQDVPPVGEGGGYQAPTY